MRTLLSSIGHIIARSSSVQPPLMPSSLLLSRLCLGHLVLLWERIWRALLWPATAITIALLALALLSRLPDPPETLHWALLGAIALFPIIGLLWGLRHFRWPTKTEVIARLDRGLPHAPTRTLLDRLATNTPQAQTLWTLHQAYAAKILAAAPLPFPQPGLANQDPKALRALIPLGTLIAFTILYADTTAFQHALWPPAGRPVPPPPVVQAWLEPPAYAEGATVQAISDHQHARTPQGSRLRLSVTGTEAQAFFANLPLPLVLGEDFVFPLSTPTQAVLSVQTQGRETWRTEIEVFPDLPPQAEINLTPDRGDGRLRLSLHLTDDLGLHSAELHIKDPRDSLDIIPLDNVQGRTITIPVVLDTSRDPRAGLPIRLILVAKDGAGQSTQTTLETIFPERQWRHPLAQQIAHARRLLLKQGPLAVPDLEHVAINLRAANAPLATVLAVATAARYAHHHNRLWEAEGLLWESAIEIEEGPAGRALAEAARAAHAAQNLQDTTSIATALDSLLEALVRLAQTAPSLPQASHSSSNTTTIRAEDLLAAAAEAKRLAAEGRLEEARDLLSQLADTLQRLSEYASQSQPPDPAQQASAQTLAEKARRLLAEQTAVADQIAQMLPPKGFSPNALSREEFEAEIHTLSERLRSLAHQIRHGAEQRRLRRDAPLTEEAETAANALQQAAEEMMRHPLQGRHSLSAAAQALAHFHQALLTAAAQGRLFPDDGIFRTLPPQQREQLRSHESQHAQRIEQQRAQIEARFEQILTQRAATESAEAALAKARATPRSLASQAAIQRRIAEDAAHLESDAENLGLRPVQAAHPAARAANALESEYLEEAAAAQAEAVAALQRLLEQIEQASGQGSGASGFAPGAIRPWEGGRPDLSGQGNRAQQWQQRIQQRLQENNAPESARRYWRRLLRLPEGL